MKGIAGYRTKAKVSKAKRLRIQHARQYRDYFPEAVRKDPRKVLEMDYDQWVEVIDLIERHQRLRREWGSV